jgi:hypothetical protein
LLDREIVRIAVIVVRKHAAASEAHSLCSFPLKRAMVP